MSLILKNIFTKTRIKPLIANAISQNESLKVTYPNLNNKQQLIENALQNFISCIAACETGTLRALTKKGPIKVGVINFKKIESEYDLNHWFNGGGKDNKLKEVRIDVQIQTNANDNQFLQLKAKTESLCPVYQMVTQSGVEVKSNWTKI